MSNIRALAVDLLAHPGLLNAREQVRNIVRWSTGLGQRTKRRVTRGEYVSGLLSIVVPAYGVERYISECLQSLSVQNYRNVEIIVVDDGSPDRSAAIARRWSLRDPRIRVLRQQNAGLSAARNAGVAEAKGEFLAFLDSDDFVDRHAYTDAITLLAETGSDFAVMPYRRELKGSYPQAAAWVRNAHAVERANITLDDFPEIMVNAVAWSKVYRRRFWDESGLEFPVGALYEDQALSMEAFARASSFDVLSRVSINWRMREDRTSITQQIITAQNIQHHDVAVRTSLDALERFGSPLTRQERLRQVMNNNLGEFLPNIRQMDDEAWDAFTTFVRYLWAQVTDKTLWNQVDARKKILLSLIHSGNRSLALRFLENHGWQQNHFSASPRGEYLVGRFPLDDELRAHVEESSFILSPEESALVSVARRLERGEHDDLILTLVSYIDRVRPSDVDAMHFELVNATSGTSVPLAAERASMDRGALGHTRRYADMSEALFRVSIPSEAFSEDGEYGLRVTASCGEISRLAVLKTDWKTERSSAVEFNGGRVLVPVRHPDGEVKLAIYTPRVVAERLTVGQDSVQLEVRSDRPLSRVSLVRDGDRFSLDRSISPLRFTGSTWRASIKLPKSVGTGSGRVTYDLRAFEPNGAFHPVYVTPTVEGLSELEDEARFVWTKRVRTRISQTLRGQSRQEFTTGCLTLVDRRNCLSISEIGDTDQGEIRMKCTRIDGSPDVVRATARVGSSTFDLPIVLTQNHVELQLPLRASLWGRPVRPYPSGTYSIELEGNNGAPLSLDVHDRLAPRLPKEYVFDELRVSVSRQKGALLGVRIEPPLDEDEVGGGNKWRLKDWFYTLSPQGPRSVVFRNLYGEAANDSALAVHKELQRRQSPLELIWAVKDYAVDVPEGARAVLEDSKSYFEALGTANYVMVNVHQPDWYVKPRGQILIETFHGYPFKLNGYRWWKKLGFPAERQESFFKRAAEWDYLVSPSEYATPILEEFFRPEHSINTEVLEIGYPRNDVLLSPESTVIRERTREILGIDARQKAVLYAPTFRDYVSADDMSAAMIDFVDLSKLASALGDEYVILLRGHPFNARKGTNSGDGIINVTDYPDINDLILASDIAVMDYSSLRFDYALTGKPSLFYVPDQERYFAGRDSYMPFEDTAPGPKLRNAGELIQAISNADSLAKKFEHERRDFISSYMELEDGQAAKRLVDIVFASRGDA